MKVAVLTSSRADYGIYRPLLKKLEEDTFFDLTIIAFGTHMSRYHAYTVSKIEEDGFEVKEQIESLILGDTPEAISNAIGNTITRFSSLWSQLHGKIDLVFALGDRYEMFAAVAASVPFNIKIAHIHGGEVTLGAIDNKFRHSISLMSHLHFTSTIEYANRVENLIDSKENIFSVGSLSLDNLTDIQLLSKREFLETYNIDLGIPTVLSTLHPETVDIQGNATFADTLSEAFERLSSRFQIIITMPNADTMGSVIRARLENLVKKNEKIIGVESFGTLGYFSCMKHCSFLIGNTSSGLIEAPSLHKYVINVGKRQAGRARSKNVFDSPFQVNEILNLATKVEKLRDYDGSNIYASTHGSVSSKIVSILKQIKIDETF